MPLAGLLLATVAHASGDGLYVVKPLDGVNVEAVETYPGSRKNELGMGVGIYPFNAYYTGILLNGSYQYNLNRTFSWEVLNATYSYGFDKGLTTELAEEFAVNPRRIDRLRFMFSSNVLFYPVDGKFVLRGKHIRYFRGAVVGGLGLVNTEQTSAISTNIGLRFEVLVSETFAWRLDVRDSITVPGMKNFVTFTLGSRFSF